MQRRRTGPSTQRRRTNTSTTPPHQGGSSLSRSRSSSLSALKRISYSLSTLRGGQGQTPRVLLNDSSAPTRMTKVLVDVKEFVLIVYVGEFFVLLVDVEEEDKSTRRMKFLRILSLSLTLRNLSSSLMQRRRANSLTPPQRQGVCPPCSRLR